MQFHLPERQPVDWTFVDSRVTQFQNDRSFVSVASEGVWNSSYELHSPYPCILCMVALVPTTTRPSSALPLCCVHAAAQRARVREQQSTSRARAERRAQSAERRAQSAERSRAEQSRVPSAEQISEQRVIGSTRRLQKCHWLAIGFASTGFRCGSRGYGRTSTKNRNLEHKSYTISGSIVGENILVTIRMFSF